MKSCVHLRPNPLGFSYLFGARMRVFIPFFQLSAHVRGSLKNHPFTEYQNRRIKICENFRRSIGLDAILGPDGSLGFPPDYDHSGLNFSPKTPFFPDDDHSLPADFSDKFPVDPYRSFKG